MPNAVQIVCLVIASGFLLWSIVSLVRSIVKKKKRVDGDSPSCGDGSIEKKGEE